MDEWYSEPVKVIPTGTLTPIWIAHILIALVHECVEHNNEYHHHTPENLLAEARQVIEKLVKSNT